MTTGTKLKLAARAPVNIKKKMVTLCHWRNIRIFLRIFNIEEKGKGTKNQFNCSKSASKNTQDLKEQIEKRGIS